MQPLVIAQLLALLFVANGTPVVARLICGHRLSFPVDGGILWPDGWPLLGPSKTIRGIAASILATSVAAPLIGLDWTTGTLVAGAAMTGDLISSFAKRRLHLPPSSRATGLDQIPEALLPLLCAHLLLGLTILDVITGVALFVVGEIALSRLLYRLRIRRHPY